MVISWPCACSRFVSLIQPFAVSFVPHYTTHYFIRSQTSFSTPRVIVSYLNNYTFPNPQKQHFRLFLPANCLPHKKPRSPFVVVSNSRFRSFRLAIEMRITFHTPPEASYYPFQQHIIIIIEI